MSAAALGGAVTLGSRWRVTFQPASGTAAIRPGVVRALELAGSDHPKIYAAGYLASVTDPRTGHVLPRWRRSRWKRARRWPAT